MFHNYFFLKRISRQLNEKLTGHQLLECFSQNKDELILGFGTSNDQFYLRANLNPQVGLIDVLEDFKRAKKNSVDLFAEVADAEVAEISPFQYERSFAISFTNGYALIFKMHSSRSNILLVKDGNVTNLFRNQLLQDQELVPAELHKELNLTQERFKELEGKPSKFLPALGKEVRTYLSAQGYESKTIEERWVLFQHVIKELETNPVFIYRDYEKPVLSLLKLDLEVLLETTDSLEAAARYYELFTRDFYLNTEKQKAVKTFENKIKKTESYIAKTTQKLEQVRDLRSYEELANIIMANLHQIRTGQEQAKLFDFYTEKDIEIKLKPSLSPQKNAENLYRKSKNQKIEIAKLEDNIQQRKNQLHQLEEELHRIKASEDFKSLRKQYNIKQEQEEEVVLPYHKVVFEGFDILIGKNAKHNDHLTLKIANKDDLWLHAKDVAGSHVVIKHQAGKSFPKNVMERAGELAAWFSKRKTDSLCPVIYTPKKYIRKSKGAAPGAVIVEKEEVMMVEPRGM